MTQQVSDSMNTKPGEKGYVEQAQDALNTGAKYVQDTATGMLSFFPTLNDSIRGKI